VSHDVDLNAAIRAFDIVRYLVGKGADQTQNEEWTIDCPTCGKKKLVVNTFRKAWHCWVCEGLPGAKGKGGLIDLIAILENIAKPKAVEKLIAETQYAPVEYNLGGLAYPGFSGLTQARELPPPECWQPADGTLPYLAKRGILPDDARAFGLVWCSAGRYANRLIFPVWEEGRLVYYQGRAMWEEKDRPGERYVKALNPSREEGAAVSSEVLMNLDQARHHPRVAIVEGPIDCIKAGASAVCTFGKKISGTQIAKLQRSGVRAIDLMWDGPSEREPQGAWPEMMAAVPMLGLLFDVRLVFLDRGDPGEKTREELNYWRAHARPVNGAASL
jgi:ssDNA-binding Zn-finger/Zn-ribbon topoisomerase 1